MDRHPTPAATPALRTLPGDDVRRVMWRFADRTDLQALAQAARRVARGPVARLVASGARRTQTWTPEKTTLLTAFEEAGLTEANAGATGGGLTDGPGNLALALIAFELSWVDAGAATIVLANHLALGTIRHRGTPAQVARYLSRRAGARANGVPWRAAFCLTEPIPHVGVEAGTLSGKVRVASWQEDGEPVLQIDKRGRFITNMGFANLVIAAVESADERIKGTCLVALEEGDAGVFDRGAPTRKLVHQLSSTTDPVFSLRVPAGRIVGGYTVAEGVIVPRFRHGEIIESVLRRTRVAVGSMTSAKLLSAVEPILRYQRARYRGGESAAPGTARYDMGLQQREDALHRLLDVWATGEASAALGFAAARQFDELDPAERRKDAIMTERGTAGGLAEYKALRRLQTAALELIELEAGPANRRDTPRYRELRTNVLPRFSILDALCSVLGPAVKLWNTGHGANVLREAVSLMGGLGVTEDCPGFIGSKWMDAQLEATYEGPEAVHRRQLAVTMTNKVFLAQYRHWIDEMREIADRRPGTGACTLATAMELWLWTLNYLRTATDPTGTKLYQDARQGVTFPLADALCWLLASRCQIADVLELEAKGAQTPGAADGPSGTIQFLTDLCHFQAAQAAGEVGRIATELIFGYMRHPAWDAEGCAGCYSSDDLDALEAVMPGIASTAGTYGDVIGADFSHRPKAGPCVQPRGLETFMRLRAKLDGCLAGARLAKDRAAKALTQVTIPDALDY